MNETTTPTRAQQIEGLRLLADFLADHPHVPVPELGMVTIYPVSVFDGVDLVEFLDGLDTMPPVEPSGSEGYGTVSRPFAGVTLRGHMRLDLIGETVEVPTTTVKFTPGDPKAITAHLLRVQAASEEDAA